MAAESDAAPGQTSVDERHRAEYPGTWLRLACCEGSVHPVRIHSQSDGTVTISAPTEPHPAWIKRPNVNESVTLGWSDGGGTLILDCSAVPTADESGDWVLRVISTHDFVQRREHIRVAGNATVQLMDGRLDRVISGRVLDISEAGMKCAFEEFIPEERMNPFQWALRLDDTVVVALSVMRWSGRVNPIEFEAGFEFVDTYDSLLTPLRAYIMKQLDTRGPAAD